MSFYCTDISEISRESLIGTDWNGVWDEIWANNMDRNWYGIWNVIWYTMNKTRVAWYTGVKLKLYNLSKGLKYETTRVKMSAEIDQNYNKM